MANHIHIHVHRTVDADWNEGKHKRADNGQFGSGGGGVTGKAAQAASNAAKAKASANPAVREAQRQKEAIAGAERRAAEKRLGAQLGVNMGSKKAPPANPSNQHPGKAPTFSGPAKVGQRVEFKPEFQDKGDENMNWTVIEAEDRGRMLVRAEGSTMKIKPTQRVTREMLANAGPATAAAPGKEQPGEKPGTLRIKIKHGETVMGKQYFDPASGGGNVVDVSDSMARHLVTTGKAEHTGK